MSVEHTAPISGIASSGGLIATAGYDNRLILWHTRLRRSVACGTHDHLVNHCDFSPDGRLLVSASSDYSARVWDVPSMQLKTYLSGHSDDVLRASFSPNGRLIATCSYDSTLITYDLNGRVLARCIGHEGLVEAFAWTPDSRFLISSGTDGTIRTWFAETGIQADLRSGFAFDLDAVAVFSNSRFVVGCDDGALMHVDGPVSSTIPAHRAGVKNLVYSRHTNLLLSLGYDRRAILWTVLTGTLEVARETTLPDYVWARAATFTSQKTIAFATFGSTYALWDWEDDQWDCGDYRPSSSVNSVMCQSESVYSIGDAGLLTRDGVAIGGPGTLCNCLVMFNERLLTAGQLGLLYDAVSGRALYSAKAPINCLAAVAIANRSALAVGTYAGEVHFLLTADDGEQDTPFAESQTVALACNAIKGMAVIGSTLVCGAADGTLTAIDLETRTVIRQIRGAHEGIMNGIARVNDGFATISRDLTLRLWSADCQLLKTVKSRHTNSIKSIAASFDGHYIATGSYRGTVDMFDVAAGRWVGELLRPTMSGISSLAWDDVANEFVAGAYDGRTYRIAV